VIAILLVMSSQLTAELQGHARLDKSFTEGILEKVIPAFET
jgi:hypothetical protein